MRRAVRAAFVGLALLLACAAPAAAHPHVFVTAASEIIYAPDGAMTGVRHAWTFDDMFSAYALQGLESKTKGVYTRDELKDLAQTNVESLKEFAFFTFAKSGGRKSKFNDPVDYYLDYNGTALVLHFTLPLKAPLKTKQLALEIYDPSYFVDFSLAKDNPIQLVGAPAGCKMAIARPNDGSAAAKKLDESTFTDGENSNYGAMFANKITVDCP
ncbi:MAG: transporter substrate-binding protein [Tardiphaga sp.]|nr:transporter substrate-binding protein [Tardiphaga sp.]